MSTRLAPSLPALINAREKEGEPGIQNQVTNVCPYTRVGRVADRKIAHGRGRL